MATEIDRLKAEMSEKDTTIHYASRELKVLRVVVKELTEASEEAPKRALLVKALGEEFFKRLASANSSIKIDLAK